MVTAIRHLGICRTGLLVWAWCVISFGEVTLFAQSSQSRDFRGPALIEPTPSQTPGASPFLQGPVIEHPEPVPPAESAAGTDDSEWRMSRYNLAPVRQERFAPNYWVISFRECPQAGSPCLADQNTQYFYHGPNGEKGQRPASDFYASLRPDVPVCMMVHGSLMEWEQMLHEGHQTYEWLKLASPNTQFQMVFVSWPSERPLALVLPVDFAILGKRSSYNGLYLSRVLSRIPSDVQVSMIGHSHGARLVASALHLAGGGDVYGYRLSKRETPWPRMRAVMAAAALDHHWFDPNQRYDRALVNAESLLNLRNEQDFALRLYLFRLPVGQESLGRAGFDWRDRRLLGENYGKVRDVEVTDVLGTAHIWPWFTYRLQIGQMLAPYVFFQDDLPPAVSLKPRRGWPFNSEARTVVVNKPPLKPQQPAAPQLVRGTPPPKAKQPGDRETIIPTESGRATVTPSGMRLFGNPVRAPRK